MLCVTASGLFAQTATTTTTATPSTLAKKDNYKKMDYFHVELGWHHWVNKPDSIKTKWYNRTLNVYGTYPMNLGKSKNTTFVLGAGISAENFYSNGWLTRDTSGTYFRPISSTYKNNKFATVYAIAPITFTFKTQPDKFGKQFKISAGMQFGYLLNSHTKFRGVNPYTVASVRTKDNVTTGYNLAKVRYDARLSIGYDFAYIFGTYSIISPFTSGKGYKTNPINIGIGVVGF